MTTTTPATIGPYRVDREIGRGGMGVVFLGHDTRLDRAFNYFDELRAKMKSAKR